MGPPSGWARGDVFFYHFYQVITLAKPRRQGSDERAVKHVHSATVPSHKYLYTHGRGTKHHRMEHGFVRESTEISEKLRKRSIRQALERRGVPRLHYALAT